MLSHKKSLVVQKKICEYVEPTVLYAKLTGVKGIVLQRLYEPDDDGRTSARKHLVLNYPVSFKNSAFKSSRPCLNSLHSKQTSVE